MKKFYSFAIAFLFGAIGTFAQDVDLQTLQFANADGSIIPDGSVIVVNTGHEDIFGRYEMKIPLYVFNNSDEIQGGQVREDITQLPNGMFQSCVFGACKGTEEPSILETEIGDIAPKKLDDANTEWFPAEHHNKWQATLQLLIYEREPNMLTVSYPEIKAYGPKITVVFEYPNPSGIDKVADSYSVEKVVERYTVDGKKISEPQKGINILKLTNGKVIKEVIK